MLKHFMYNNTVEKFDSKFSPKPAYWWFKIKRPKDRPITFIFRIKQSPKYLVGMFLDQKLKYQLWWSNFVLLDYAQYSANVISSDHYKNKSCLKSHAWCLHGEDDGILSFLFVKNKKMQWNNAKVSMLFNSKIAFDNLIMNFELRYGKCLSIIT